MNKKGTRPLEIQVVKLRWTHIMPTHRIPAAEKIPGDFILRRKWPATVERRCAQGVECLLKKLRMMRGSFEGGQQPLAQIQIESLPTDAEQPAVETFPKPDSDHLFDCLARQAIDFFHIPVVIAGPFRAFSPLDKEFRTAVKKQIRVKDQEFVARGKGHGIEKLEKEVVAASIAEACGISRQ